ncbi:MAG: SDR family NAD(P)-dependent oxidoreductase [Myxococcota bacterium]
MSKTRYVLLTGGTRGIGVHAAEALAEAGWTIVLVGRTMEALERVARPIQARRGLRSVQPEVLDLAGLEWNVGINHVGHAHLTWGLLDRLQANAPIVLTSSGAHRLEQDMPYMKAPRWPSAEELLWAPTDDPEMEQRRYPSSKLCNALFAVELERRLKVRSRINEPGFVPGTGLARDQPAIASFLFTWIMPAFAAWFPDGHTARHAGRHLAQMVLEPPSASLVVVDQPRPLPEVDRDEVRATELWTATLQAIARIRTSSSSIRHSVGGP